MAASDTCSVESWPLVGVANPRIDPIGQLEDHLGWVVSGFEHGHEMIKMSMEQDKLNAENLKEMERNLRFRGDDRTADALVLHSGDALQHSLKQVLPMRAHIEEIADLLNEMADPDVQKDANSLSSILHAIRAESDAAGDIAKKGKEKFEALCVQLRQIQDAYHRATEKAKQQAKENEDAAKEHEETAATKQWESNWSAGGSVVTGLAASGKTALGAFMATQGATVTASIPLVGELLTTTATGIVAFNPAGIAVGVGLAVLFGGVAVYTGWQATVADGESKKASAAKEAAEKDAEENRAIVVKSEETEVLAGGMVQKAREHERMWDGVSMAAEGAAHQLSTVARTDPTGARRKKFEDKIQKYASKLLDFAQAIDDYLFFLHKQNFFPPNFHLKNAVGKEKFLKMEADWNAAAASLAAPALSDQQA